MPQPLMPEKWKLSSSMKTYKTWNYYKKKMSFSLEETGMQKQGVERYLE